MRIGFDAKRFFHNKVGLGNYSRDFIFSFVSNFPNEDVFLFNPKEKAGYEFGIKEKEIVRQMSIISPKNIFSKIFHSIWRYRGLTKLIKKYNLDIYHGLSGELPKGIHKLKGVKKVVTVHDLIYIRYPKLYSCFDAKMHKKKVEYACRVADIIIATSNQTKNDIIQFIKGVDINKIRVVYQGCNDAYLQEYNPGYKVSVIQKYDLPEKYVLYVGKIEKRKNLVTLVKALNNLPDDIKLVVLGGKTEYFNEVMEFVRKYDISNRIWFLDEVTTIEMAVIYQMANVFVYPSIFEGFGIPLVEAMFSKTFVITSNVSCLPEIAGKHSYTIDPYDVEDLTKKILEIVDNQELSKKLVQANYDYALETFDKNKIIKEVYKMYTGL